MGRHKKNELIKIFELYRLYQYLTQLSPAQTDFIQKVDVALERLPARERQLISLRYLQNDSEYEKDQNIYKSLQISYDNYTKIRKNAFHKLALMFSMDADQIKEDSYDNEK